MASMDDNKLSADGLSPPALRVDDVLCSANNEKDESIADEIRAMDRDGDGIITESELVSVGKEVHRQKVQIHCLREIVIAVVVGSLVICGVLLGLMLLSNEVTKDVRPTDKGLLMTTRGVVVATDRILRTISLRHMPEQQLETLKKLKDITIQMDNATIRHYIVNGFDQSMHEAGYKRLVLYTSRGDKVHIGGGHVFIQNADGTISHPMADSDRRRLLADTIADTDSATLEGAMTLNRAGCEDQLASCTDGTWMDGGGHDCLALRSPNHDCMKNMDCRDWISSDDSGNLRAGDQCCQYCPPPPDLPEIYCRPGLEFEVAAPTSSTPRQCALLTECKAGSKEVVAPTDTTDRKCSDSMSTLLEPPSYERKLAQTLWRFASASYADADINPADMLTTCLQDLAPVLRPLNLTSFNDDGESDSSGFVSFTPSRSQSREFITLTIRGTVTGRNWINDIRMARVQFPSPVCPRDCYVHAGFLAHWQGRKRQKIVPELRRLHEAHPRALVYVVGHSLGGAAAVLAAYDLQFNFGIPVHGLFTYGAPRPGNADFAQVMSDSSIWPPAFVHWRHANAYDPYPSIVGRALGYRHSGIEVFQRPGADTEFCHASPDCGQIEWCSKWYVVCMSQEDHESYFDEYFGGCYPPAPSAPSNDSVPLPEDRFYEETFLQTVPTCLPGSGSGRVEEQLVCGGSQDDYHCRCPEGQHATRTPGSVPCTNSCGAEGSASFDWAFLQDAQRCCDGHDYCYSYLNATEPMRMKACDKGFSRCLQRYGQSRLYSNLVQSMMQKVFFDRSQAHATTCVAS